MWFSAELSALQCVHRELLEARVVAISMGAAATVGLVVAVLGPVGLSTQFDLLHRVAIVGTCCAICWPICHALGAAVFFMVRSRSLLQVFLGWVVGGLFISVPCSGVVYAVYALFAEAGLGPDFLVGIFVNTVVILLPVSLLVHYVAYVRVKLRLAAGHGPGGTGHAAPEETDDEQASTSPGEDRSRLLERFFDRIPDTVGRDLVYLSVSGHYIDVVTTTGSCLILMRFADAVAMLGDLGMRVHRSHWVAYRHIVASIRRDGRMFLRLTGPEEIPVSRSYIQRVRAALSSLRGVDHVT